MKSKFDTIVETYISTGRRVAPIQPVRTAHDVPEKPKNATKNTIDKTIRFHTISSLFSITIKIIFRTRRSTNTTLQN